MQEDNMNYLSITEYLEIEGILHNDFLEHPESPIVSMDLLNEEKVVFNDDPFENRHDVMPYCEEDYISDSNDIMKDIEKFGSVQTDTQLMSPQLVSTPSGPQLTHNVLVCRGIKKDKNSNAIKKIGRIILDNLKKYELKQKPNLSLNSMLRILSRHARIGRFQINKRDKFNTHHFKLLLSDADPQVVWHNLKVTQTILNRNLRSNVLLSPQITDQNKIVYLNTLKCTSLRCANNKLAVRLQMHS